MKIVFVSNYFNHHQESLALAFEKATGGQFHFIACEVMGEFRRQLGYKDMNHAHPFIVRAYENKDEFLRAKTLIEEADMVIAGSAPESLLAGRKTANKPIFYYAERPLKNGFESLKYPIRLFRWKKKYPNKKPLYMLCASGYTASDYKKFGVFKNKCYKWAYFPTVKKYENVENLIGNKEKNSLVWVGRFIDWKHPEVPIEIAKRLQKDGYDFTLNMIGNGELLETIKGLAEKEGLEKQVRVLGAMPTEKVREYMENSRILLFTSDRKEGWGAVLNEGMNSGCVPVANRLIGSAPFLIQDGENGFLYKNGDIDGAYQKVKLLLDDCARQETTSKKAYETMVNEWNAENAVAKFLTVAKRILDGDKRPFPFENGVCSKA